MKQINVVLALFLSVFISSCSADDAKRTSELDISQEIKDLIYFKGDETASTVIITAQGGPLPNLATSAFDRILEPVNTANLLTVNVHQVQTLSPNLFTSNDEITFEQAID